MPKSCCCVSAGVLQILELENNNNSNFHKSKSEMRVDESFKQVLDGH